MKTLWLKVSTTSLDPEHAQVLEIAYRPQINGKFTSETQHVLMKPVLLDEDKRYGGANPEKIIKWYNEKNRDPRKQLAGFRFSATDPYLFLYAKGTLQYGMPDGRMRDPVEWLAKGRAYPEVALANLLDHLAQHHQEGLWYFAGHNVAYDAVVFRNWFERILGTDTLLNNVFNLHWNLDTVMLARFLGVFGKIAPQYNSYSLSVLANCLGIALPEFPNAKDLLNASIELAESVGTILTR